MGRAVTAHDMPTPSTNCQVNARAPTQPGAASIAAAAGQPKSSGMPSARPAVMLLSRLCCQACDRSSSMPAIHTNSITAHQTMLFRLPMTARVKTISMAMRKSSVVFMACEVGVAGTL